MAHGMWRPLSWDVTECLLPFLPRTALSPAALQHGETPCCYPGWVSNPIGAKDSCPLVPCSSRALCVLMQLLHAISDAPVPQPSCLTLTLLSLPGKTRTKDKYRVVYTDHQRLELEKEFHYSRYITIRRKAELAAALGLTERQVSAGDGFERGQCPSHSASSPPWCPSGALPRPHPLLCMAICVFPQVKIWFQNRRAKERKVNKKKLQQQSQPTSTTTPTPPAVGTPGPMGTLCSGSAPSLVSSSPLTIKEEFMP